jgi:hypothetical protein
MESNYNNREFEQLVKKNADQYRMVPSDKVWKGINTALHSRRRWYGIGLATLLLLTGVSVTWVMSSYPVSEKSKTTTTTSNTIKPIIPLQPAVSEQPAVVTSITEINQLLSKNRFTREEKQPVPSNGNTIQVISDNSLTQSLLAANDQFSVSVVKPSVVKMAEAKVTSAPESNTSIETSSPVYNFNFNLLSGGGNLTDNKQVTTSGSIMRQEHVAYPLTIESVLNSYKPTRVKKKISWQLYFAPTISYRKLSANKSYKNPSAFADPVTYPFTSLTDINKAVTHKPDMGLEFGFATKYPLTKNLKLRAGLQFNVNRYDIKAFVYNGEQATINLNGGDGTSSVTAWTNYRNYNGYKSDWLKNFYFSVSAPFGAEVTLFGNKKTSFGVAGTIQPTYILSDRAYLISTDYKNYAKVPWLIRNMNVNTSFETFINYTSRNNTKWQVGPQVRYQVLSSFQNKYPVRENLFDFGLKVGVTLNQ